MVKKNFISQSQPEGGQSRPRARNWIIDEDNCLLGILKEIVLKGKNNGGHFTTEQWQNVTDEYKERTGQNDRGKLQMQNRYKILKKQYSLNYKLRNKSGWGWDEGKNMVIAPTAKDWEVLIKENDEYLRIKNKAFPQFDDMDFLCGGNTSKGRWWFGTTDDFNEREGSTSSENELEDIDGPHNNEIDLSDSEEVQEVEETQVPFNGTQPPPQPIPSSTPIIKHHAQPSGLKRKFKNISRRQVSGIEVENNLSKMIELQKQRVEITKELVDSRKGVPTEMNECMDKIMKLSGVTSDLCVAGAEAIKKKENRHVVNMLNGQMLLSWLKKQMDLQNAITGYPSPIYNFQHQPPLMHQFQGQSRMSQAHDINMQEMGSFVNLLNEKQNFRTN